MNTTCNTSTAIEMTSYGADSPVIDKGAFTIFQNAVNNTYQIFLASTTPYPIVLAEVLPKISELLQSQYKIPQISNRSRH